LGNPEQRMRRSAIHRGTPGEVTLPSRERNVGRPPRFEGLAEPPPTIEPRLSDIPEFAGPDLEDVVTPVDAGLDEPPVTESFARVAVETALGDDRLRELVHGGRHVVIGVSRRPDDKDRREVATLVVVYAYERGRAIEAWLAGDERELHVADVAEADYQPAPADDEIAHAIELARSHGRIRDVLADEFEATAILASDVDAGDLHHGTRRFVVGFGPADERQPRIRALVDLGTEEVLAVETNSAPPSGKERSG
jgi:hypothetical protein